MSLSSRLSRLAEKTFGDLGLPPEFGEVVPSQRPELAQFQCNGALRTAKELGRNPVEVATAVAERLQDFAEIASASVVKPGFVNLIVADEALADWSNRSRVDACLGYEPSGGPLTVIVDYAGPNVAKAMHVGHLRSTIIGDALARLFRFAGHRVIRDPHFGDWGLQIGLLIAAMSEIELDPASISLDDLQRIYPEAARRAKEDEEFAARARDATVRLQSGDADYRRLWSQMKSVSERSQRADFEALGVEFDLWYGESDVRDALAPMVEDLRAAGLAEESEDALIIRVEEAGDNREIPPLILRSSAGGFLYSTTDLATLAKRVRELEADLVLYVVDRRQADHFVQVFRAARKAGILPPAVAVEHVGFGTMNGPDGKPFRTREGGVVRLADVIEMIGEAARRRLDGARIAQGYSAEERETIASQVGIAALKFADLVNNRASDYRFDLERFTSFEGKTGPYVQYAVVRIRSILRNASERGVRSLEILPPVRDVERRLMLELLQLQEVVDRSITLRAPNHVAEYAYVLASRFNRFFEECHILSEPDEARRGSWLALAEWTQRTLVSVLDLLGIAVPERM